jgi:chloramphenicol 3-O phosphotransferase
MYSAYAALTASGANIIVDDVLFDARVFEDAVNKLHSFNVLFVGVRCPFAVAEQREQERGDRFLGLVKAHYDIIHAHGVYDVEVDTSVLTPMACALQIKDRLQNGPPPDAFQRLWDKRN